MTDNEALTHVLVQYYSGNIQVAERALESLFKERIEFESKESEVPLTHRECKMV